MNCVLLKWLHIYDNTSLKTLNALNVYIVNVIVYSNEFASGFNARPKIPRTPDGVVRPISRGSPSEGPPPQPKYSDSLPTPRPGSGGRISSKLLHGERCLNYFDYNEY